MLELSTIVHEEALWPMEGVVPNFALQMPVMKPDPVTVMVLPR